VAWLLVGDAVTPGARTAHLVAVEENDVVVAVVLDDEKFTAGEALAAAHDKRPGNTNGLQKGPRPREMLAKGRSPEGPRPRLGARVPATHGGASCCATRTGTL
jgi:hypothetical protein